jgi:hypothetical protein
MCVTIENNVVLVQYCRLALVYLFLTNFLPVSSNIKEPFNCMLTKGNAICKHFVKYEGKHWSQNLVSCQYLLLDSPHCCWTYLSGLLRGNKTCCSLQLDRNTREHLQLTVRAACIQFSWTKTNVVLLFINNFCWECSCLDTVLVGYLKNTDSVTEARIELRGKIVLGICR